MWVHEQNRQGCFFEVHIRTVPTACVKARKGQRSKRRFDDPRVRPGPVRRGTLGGATRYQPVSPSKTIAVRFRLGMDGFSHFHYGNTCPTDHDADSPTTVSRWPGDKPKSALVQRHTTLLT